MRRLIKRTVDGLIVLAFWVGCLALMQFAGGGVLWATPASADRTPQADGPLEAIVKRIL